MTEVLKKMANFYSDMLKTKIDILMDLIQPLMLAFIAVIIGLIVASIFLPMAAMISVIQ
ncbi:MAG: type II secretion system F family protein [bacterium]